LALDEEIRWNVTTFLTVGFAGLVLLGVVAWALSDGVLRALFGREDIFRLVALIPAATTVAVFSEFLSERAARPAFAQYGLRRIVESTKIGDLGLRVTNAFSVIEHHLKVRLGPSFFEDLFLRPIEERQSNGDEVRPKTFKQLARALSSAWVAAAAAESHPWPTLRKGVFDLADTLGDSNADEAFRKAVNKAVAEIDPWFRQRALDYEQDTLARFLGSRPYFLPVLSLVVSVVLVITQLTK